MNNDTEKKIGQLQLFEQSLQTFALQKQQFQAQLLEIESALKELEKVQSAYKIVGGIMVSGSRDELMKDMQQKKEVAELRIKAVEKQEKQIREKASALQAEVVKELKPEKK